MRKRNKNKVLSGTAHKTIIRHGELVNILNEDEIHMWHNILEKIRIYDKECNVDDSMVEE